MYQECPVTTAKRFIRFQHQRRCICLLSEGFHGIQIVVRMFKTSLVHSYNTRASSCGKYHIQFSRLNQQWNSFLCFGAKAWNCLPSQVCNLPKLAFKKSIRKALFAALEGEEDYIEAPYLLSKINLHFT